MESDSSMIMNWLIRQKPSEETIGRLESKIVEAGFSLSLDSLLGSFEDRCTLDSRKVERNISHYKQKFGWYNSQTRDVSRTDITLGSINHFSGSYFLKERKSLNQAADYLLSHINFINTEYFQNQNYRMSAEDPNVEIERKAFRKQHEHIQDIFCKAVKKSLIQKQASRIETYFLNQFIKEKPERFNKISGISNVLLYENLLSGCGSCNRTNKITNLLIPIWNKRKDNPLFKKQFKEAYDIIINGDFEKFLEDSKTQPFLAGHSDDPFKSKIYAELRLDSKTKSGISHTLAINKCVEWQRKDLAADLLLAHAYNIKFDPEGGSYPEFYKPAINAFKYFCELQNLDSAKQAYKLAIEGRRNETIGCSLETKKKYATGMDSKREEIIKNSMPGFRESLFKNILDTTGITITINQNGSPNWYDFKNQLDILDLASKDFNKAIPNKTTKRIAGYIIKNKGYPLTMELNDSFCSGKREILINKLEDYIGLVEEEDKKELSVLLKEKGSQLSEDRDKLREFSSLFYNNLSFHHRLARTLDTYLPEEFYTILFDAARFRSTSRWSESYPDSISYEKVLSDAERILSDVETQFPSIGDYGHAILNESKDGTARVEEERRVMGLFR
ncbi:MAG: hypothetical protein U9R34_07810 [Nanoarchaeota archaeon]|nr:hypothetical protein [Nanoarchaeota archaeon]